MDAEHTATHDPAGATPDPGSSRVAAARAARAAAPNGQLHLHVGDGADRPDWRLDDETRAVGRRGIAQARAALRSARADHLGRDADAPDPAHEAASSRRRTAA
jgi:hypothetical protein